jgi:hypothetical protein
MSIAFDRSSGSFVRRLGLHDLYADAAGRLMLHCVSSDSQGRSALNREVFRQFTSMAAPSHEVTFTNTQTNKQCCLKAAQVPDNWRDGSKGQFQSINPSDWAAPSTPLFPTEVVTSESLDRRATLNTLKFGPVRDVLRDRLSKADSADIKINTLLPRLQEGELVVLSREGAAFLYTGPMSPSR